MKTSLKRVFLGLTAVALLGGIVWVARERATRAAAPARALPGQSGLLSTSQESLDLIIERGRQRTAQDPGDGKAAVMLADALMRAARVRSDARLAIEAERVIRATLAHDPRDYAAERMLGVVYLSQHRFTEALSTSREAQRQRPEDAWNYAVAGDALLELGRYGEAFDAFDELNRRRPDAAAYARAAYARELQGDVVGAIRFMQMAAEGTGAHDAEGQAWYRSQLGSLRLLEGRVDDAEREFAHADFIFPGHPYARMGHVRVLIAHGRYQEAAAALAGGPATPETVAIRGDLARRLGNTTAADEAYREAERLEREGWEQEEPQPAALARFLAERRLKAEEAVGLAERAAATRQDIPTLDALAWAYFRAGKLDLSTRAIAGALRTGTRDPRIRCHADAITAAAAGRLSPAAEVCDPLESLIRPAATTSE